MQLSRESYDLSGLIAYLWQEGDLSYKLDGLQTKILTQIETTRSGKVCILSSRQIGKSYLAVCIAIAFCIKHPGSIVRILAATLKQVADIVNDNLAPIMQDAPPGLIQRFKSDQRWRVDRSSLRLGSLDRSNVDSNRGGNASLVIYEEGGFVPSEDYKYACESVIGPQLIRSGGREVHISSPSEDEFHYLHTKILPLAEHLSTAFRFTVHDSPSISEAQITMAAERCGGVHTEAFRREYLAEIIRSHSLMVVPEFKESLHVKAFELPSHYNACISIDMGGAKDKTGILSLVYDFINARLLVYDEAQFDQNTPTSKTVEAARGLEDVLYWRTVPLRYADVPGQVQIDMANEHGYTVGLPLKDDRDAQINSLRLLFQLEKILIHPRCRHLIHCLNTARYNNQRSDFERSETHGHADILMALVYGHRMIDRVSNPFPARTVKMDTQLHAPYRKQLDQLTEVANTLVPYNPYKS